MKKYDKLIFEISKEGRVGATLPKWEEEVDLSLPEELLRKDPLVLPEVSETQVVRHYTALSNRNYGVDNGFYPLGSCTMKYNPKINEDMASLPQFNGLHPYQLRESVQGALGLMYALSEMLCEVTGMDAFSLQPAAGAQGELAGLMMIKAYHQRRGETQRTKIIVPDSAHGTNPASAHVAGFDVIEVKSDEMGGVDIQSLKSVLSDEIAGLMLTNPSTLGLFERNIVESPSWSMMPEAYCTMMGEYECHHGADSAWGYGFDVVHLNLHKTFSTPTEAGTGSGR